MIIITLLAGLILSVIAAYFSVLGIGEIFKATQIQVMVMAAALEFAKIITAVWLHLYWNKFSFLFRSYMILSVVVLAVITSMGVFGLLSKGYIEQRTKIESGIGLELQVVQNEIEGLNKNITFLKTKEEQKEKPTSVLIEKTKTRNQAKETIKTLSAESELEKETKKLIELQRKEIQLKAQKSTEEVELGPLKYVAEKVYGSSDISNIDSAAWWLIIILILVLDPLALTLIMTSSKMYKEKSTDTKVISKKTFVPDMARMKKLTKIMKNSVVKIDI